MRDPERILVIRPDRIGDVVLATPVIRALRLRFPSAYIAAMVRPQTSTVLRDNPRLDAVILDDWEEADAGYAGFFRKLQELRRHRFDTALMLLPTERHAWMTFLAGIRRRIGVGTRLYQMLTFAGSVSRNKHVERRHEADYCMDLARAIGVTGNDLTAEVFLPEDERGSALRSLERLGFNPGHPLVLINPQSGRSSPNWLAEEYRTLASRILAENTTVQVLVPFPPGSHALQTAFESLQHPRLFLEPMEDLRYLIGCISQSSVVVSSSTGPMHIAGGLGIPTVSLFCPLPACEPALWRPLGNEAITILPPENYCATRCPGDPHICTFQDGITPDDVLQALGPYITTRDRQTTIPH